MLNLIYNIGNLFYVFALLSIILVAVVAEKSLFIFNSRKISKTIAKVLQNSSDETSLDFYMYQLKLVYYKNLGILCFIRVIAPSLGLLGTILGIIKTFASIAKLTVAVSPHLLADGLWEAMLTTAIGLILSIIASCFLYIFQSILKMRLEKIYILAKKQMLENA